MRRSRGGHQPPVTVPPATVPPVTVPPATVPTAAGGRPLAYALLRTDDDGAPVRMAIGTRRGLVVMSGADARAMSTEPELALTWDKIDSAVWDDEAATLTVRTYPVDGVPGRAVALPLVRGSRLPELVRERVTASILVDTWVPLAGDRGARVIARRPAEPGDATWVVVYDAGVRGDDHGVAERLAEQLARVRSTFGV